MKKLGWIVLFFAAIAFAQEERRIWPEEFAKSETAPKPETSKKTQYKQATPKIQISSVIEDTVVGITIWRIKKGGENNQWIVERVEGGTQFKQGDQIRLSIEAARDGYLYVINREQYSDGTSGEPFLIFPTSRLSDGNNKTSVGRVIEIPSQTDNPPFFTLVPGRSNQISEVLSVFITPEPLHGLTLRKEPLPLPPTQVAEWENRWGKEVGRLEMIAGAGQQITDAELNAGIGARLLTHTDPLPQSLYYNPSSTSTQPTFINVKIQYGEK